MRHLATILKNVPLAGNGFTSAKKRCKQHLNRPTNADAMSCGSNSTTHQFIDDRLELFTKKQQTNKETRNKSNASF